MNNIRYSTKPSKTPIEIKQENETKIRSQISSPGSHTSEKSKILFGKNNEQNHREQLYSDITTLLKNLSEKELEQFKTQLLFQETGSAPKPLSRSLYNRDFVEQRMLPISDDPSHQMATYICQLEFQLRKERAARCLLDKELLRLKQSKF